MMEKASGSFEALQGNAPDGSKPVMPSEALLVALHEAKLVRDILKPKKFVLLELTPESILGSILDVVFMDNFWFVIDQDGSQVYRFESDGRFAGHVGKYGQGPGEYQQARALQRVYDGHLGVLDGMTGSIHVYTSEGQHVASTPTRGPKTGGLYPYGKGFIWEAQDTLIYSNVLSFDAHDPWHAVYQLSWPDQDQGTMVDMELAYGFAQKFSYYQEATRSTVDFPAFCKVLNQIWVGSPFNAEIEVFDSRGRFIKRLEPSCPDCLTHDHFLEQSQDYWAKNKHKDSLMTSKGRNHGIDQVGDLVFVNHGNSGYAIYTTDGSLVSPHHLRNNLGTILDTFDHHMVSRGLVPSLTSKAMTDELKELLLEAGYNPEKAEDYNEMLLISTLKAHE